jgi:hypothetical protein
MLKTVTVETGAMGEFRKLFAQLDRKAKRLRIPAPSFLERPDTRREVVKTVHSEGGDQSYAVYVVDVDVSIPVPVRKSGDWTCVAVIKKNEDGSRDAIATGHENLQLSKQFIQTNDLVCSHCNAKRNRATTLLFSDGKDLKQVGKECAKEYGFDASEAVAAFEFMDEVLLMTGGEEGDNEGYFGGGNTKRSRVFSTDVVLTAVVVDMVQLSHPYEKSKRQENGLTEENPNATWRAVLRMLTSYSNTDERPSPAVAKTIRDMKKWFRSLDKDTLIANEYIASLHSMIEDEMISERKLPLFASIYQAYVTGIRNREERVTPTVPVPEGRVVVTGKVVSLKSYDSDFGGSVTKMLVVLEDGNKVFCTAVGNATVGETITIKVTLTRKDDHFAIGKVPKEVVVAEKAAKRRPAQKNTAPKVDLKPAIVAILQQGPRTTAEVAATLGKPTAPTFSVLKAMVRRNLVTWDSPKWAIA